MKKIIGIGNALVDIMVYLPNDKFLHNNELKKGGMWLVDGERSENLYQKAKDYEKVIASGGSAANTIHGLAKLGTETAFIGKISQDEMGEIFSGDMEKANIKTNLFHSDTNTGRALAFISQDAERTFATYLGAAVELVGDDLSEKIFKGYDILHIEGYLMQNHDLMKAALQLAKKVGLEVSIDLASYNVVEENLVFLRGILKKYVDIVFANEEEAYAFSGMGPQASLDILAEYCKIAVVKVGKKGSYVKKGENTVRVEAVTAKKYDTTGAGDLYAAGFLYAYAQQKNLKQCGEAASFLAGKVIEVSGARIPDEMWEEMTKHPLLSKKKVNYVRDNANQDINSKVTQVEIIQNAKVCHMSMVDVDQPYVLGFCYGYEKDTIYLHTAKEGRKLDVIRKNPNVCLAFDVDHEFFARHEQVACSWRLKYRSVLAFGKAEILEDREEKMHGLKVMMSHYTDKEFTFSTPAVNNVQVIKIAIDKMTGRQFEM